MIQNLVLILFAAAAGGFLLLAALLYFFQHKLIYYPSAYRPSYKQSLPPGTRELEFQTSAGTQVAFYIPPTGSGTPAAKLPDRLWVLFGGNGSVALGWLGWVRESPDTGAAFLLVDYPGYGKSEGTPTPEGILNNAEEAFRNLAAQLNTDPTILAGRVSVMGHSLGAAAALQFAAHHPVERVVLISPFTSLRDMTHRVVGWPLSILLRHSFENQDRLQELAQRDRPPRVVIIHGDRDNVVPVEMGRQLAAEFPKMIHYIEVPGADHITVLDAVDEQLAPEITGESGK